ncbi:MAG TPA: class I SAM-dependent methyltransferase [Solirubrobacterales bacterium]|nr:class I SAM-dependent methyltransferase [Solirubrobacterales bacterium]
MRSPLSARPPELAAMGRFYDATWGRLFAAVYDRGLKGTEEAGLQEMRRETLRAARGRTIDLGAGTGANLPLYPDAVTELVLAEPDPHMSKQLRQKLAQSDRSAELVEAPAEQLPFEDSSFDTAVFTLVLCTVPNPEAALAEAARILKPGGKLLFVEHVRANDPGLARWQDRLEKPWRFIGDGCHCNRDTVASIEASPLTVERVERGRLPKAPPLVRPLARGTAVLR